MKTIDLRRMVADRLLVLHFELGRMSPSEDARRWAPQAAQLFAWFESWRTSPPQEGEAPALLFAIDRLLVRATAARTVHPATARA